MISSKSVLVLLAVIATCYGDGLDKKHHHHHYGMHHHQFLYYLTFLLIKLKIVFFLGTIFTISLVAGKVIAIIKLSEYMKHKYHHEEKIVYVNPHEHHDSGGYPGDYVSASEVNYIKTPSSYPTDFSEDHPPADAYINHNERYSHNHGPARYPSVKSSSRSDKKGGGSYGSKIYGELKKVADRLRGSNITDMALNEMGIKDEHCKKKFICLAQYNAQHSTILDTGFNILKDVSYQKYEPTSIITSEEECESLHDGCKEL